VVRVYSGHQVAYVYGVEGAPEDAYPFSHPTCTIGDRPGGPPEGHDGPNTGLAGTSFVAVARADKSAPLTLALALTNG
jgi:hypothetical protein